MSASYPSAQKTFTSRNNGDTIQASHVNDLQDEVNAVEGGLINGLQHDLKFTDATYDVGKSGATRPRDGFFSRNLVAGGGLSVTGGSTTATLSVTSNSSLAGSVFVGGVNSSAVNSTATDVALKESGALCWANSGNSSACLMTTTRDLGVLGSTTPVSLAVFGTNAPDAMATFFVTGAASLRIAGQFYLRGADNGVLPVYTAGGNFGSTASDAGKLNVYWSAGNSRYEIENKTASTAITVRVFYQRSL